MYMRASIWVPKLISAYARGANNGRGVYASQDREMDRDDPSNEADRHPPPSGNTAVVALGMVLGLDES